jgi:anti-sigma-K factor RskA
MSDPDDDATAAEYVLGTLDEAERAQFEARRVSDPSLQQAVRAWEERLAPLAEAAPDVAPPASLYPALAARLFGAGHDDGVVSRSDFKNLEARMRRWRSLATGCAALAAALLAWIAFTPSADRDQKFVAVLQKDAGSPAVLLDVDVARRTLTMRPVSAQEPPNKAYELWIIDPSIGAPRSLGTVAAQKATQTSLSPYDPATIARATYAITIEPAGGSPNGAPSGPPVLAGKLVPEP